MCPCAASPDPRVMGLNPELLVRGYGGIGADDKYWESRPRWTSALMVLGLVGLALWATSRMIEPGGVT